MQLLARVAGRRATRSHVGVPLRSSWCLRSCF